MEVAVAAYQACHFIGVPECNVNLTEAVVYMSLAPKSNCMEVTYDAAALDAEKTFAEPVPLDIRNAPTKLMKDLGYNKGYQYAQDAPEKLTNEVCLPPKLAGREYYKPSTQGLEAKYKLRLEQIKQWKAEHRK